MEFQLGYLLASLIAGILTILSPCVLPLLPIIIGGSLDSSKSRFRPFRIIISLAVSVIVFSIILKASTALINIPSWLWQWLSGGILIIFGIVTLFPSLWDKMMQLLRLKQSSNKLLATSHKRKGYIGDILVGASLGPVFTTCSPTYLAIVGIFLPNNWAIGFIYLSAFVLGLSSVLILIAIFGQKFVAKLSFINSPKSWFKKILALIFIIAGIFIITGFDKDIQAYLVERGFYDWLIEVEDNLADI